MPDVMLLVGTKKGGFIYRSDATREKWQLSDPALPGWSFFHLAADLRDSTPRLYAAANHWAWGRSVAKSDDMGKTWDWRSEGLGFAPDLGATILNVWHVRPGHEREPGVVYAGTQPAGLFRSEDHGRTWQSVDGLTRHPDRARWSGTGGGDSCLHSIELDPRDPARVFTAISSGGSYATRDGGETWDIFSWTAVPTNPAALAETKRWEQMGFTREVPPGVDPLAIDEMHKLRVDEKDPDRMWAQAHIGVFRSDDQGKTWSDVTVGLPSFHGFPIAVTRRGPDAAFVVPLQYEGDNFRVCPGQFAVYRTTDAGKSWEPLTNGLPGPHDYQSVYREGLDTDGLDREAVYVGTSNGEVYAGLDGGDRWIRLPGTLPPILSVTAVAL
jgi:photosystem II stability/assembly factor-like uncharacterized protein